jgi:hypothetical protein
VCDAGGRFTAEALEPGPHRVTVTHPGYATETFAIHVPHRGGFRDVRVLLVPVRVRVLEIYRHVALPLLPRPELWARWTPRELLAALLHDAERGPGHSALVQLSALLEDVYWGPGVAPQSALQRARALAASMQDADQAT